MRRNVTSTNNPSNQVVQLAIGLGSTNVTVPAWCSSIYVNLLLYVPLGTTNASGALPSASVDIPVSYAPAVIYLPIFTQTFAADPGKAAGLALSNGAAAFMPRAPGDYIFRYTYSTNLTSTTGGGPYTAGSVITGWN